MGITMGLAVDFQSPTRTLDQQLDGFRQLIAVAERHGFDSVTAGEGYGQRPDFGHLPSPLLALAALSSSTHMKLGTGVTLLPSWQPVRLAEDAALLDQILGGRLLLGVALGSPALARRFGRDPAQSGDFLDDMLAALRALWAGEDGFEGKHLQIDGGIGVRPIRLGGPVMWVGGSVRRSAERAAEWGDGWIASTSYSFDEVARQSRRYREALVARGKDPSRGVVVANRLTIVAETDADVRHAAEYGGKILERYARGGSFGDDPSVRSASGSQLLHLMDEARCVVGTPDGVIQTLRRYEAAGVTHVQARVSPADTPLELAIRTVEVLGKHVLPAIR